MFGGVQAGAGTKEELNLVNKGVPCQGWVAAFKDFLIVALSEGPPKPQCWKARGCHEPWGLREGKAGPGAQLGVINMGTEHLPFCHA